MKNLATHSVNDHLSDQIYDIANVIHLSLNPLLKSVMWN